MPLVQLPKSFNPDFTSPWRRPANAVRVNKGFLGPGGFLDSFTGQDLELGNPGAISGAPPSGYNNQQGFHYRDLTTSDYITYDTPPSASSLTFFALIRPKASINCQPVSCRTGSAANGFEFLVGGGSTQGIIRVRVKGTAGAQVSTPDITLSDQNNWAMCVGRFKSGVARINVLEEDGTLQSAVQNTNPGTVTGTQGWNVNNRNGTRDYAGDIALHGYIKEYFSTEDVEAFMLNFYELLFEPELPVFHFIPSATPTATITGTATASITESDIVTGGKTAILTLTNDTFVTGTTSEDGIAAGSDSDKAEAAGWDALVKSDLDNTDVVISTTTVANDTATITLPAYASYDITAQETITWTIPAASLTTSASPIVCTPTFTVDTVSATTARPPRLHNLDNQFATITAHRLGGVLQ